MTISYPHAGKMIDNGRSLPQNPPCDGPASMLSLIPDLFFGKHGLQLLCNPQITKFKARKAQTMVGQNHPKTPMI